MQRKIKLLGLISHAFNFKDLAKVEDEDTLKDAGRVDELLEHQLVGVSKGYRSQGDATLYTDSNTAVRLQLRHSPLVLKSLEHFWSAFMSAHEHNVISRNEHVAVMTRVCKALFHPAEFDEGKGKAEAEADWEREQGDSETMSKEGFFDSMFELADLWTMEISATAYASFIRKLLFRISELRPSSAGTDRSTASRNIANTVASTVVPVDGTDPGYYREAGGTTDCVDGSGVNNGVGGSSGGGDNGGSRHENHNSSDRPPSYWKDLANIETMHFELFDHDDDTHSIGHNVSKHKTMLWRRVRRRFINLARFRKITSKLRPTVMALHEAAQHGGVLPGAAKAIAFAEEHRHPISTLGYPGDPLEKLARQLGRGELAAFKQLDAETQRLVATLSKAERAKVLGMSPSEMDAWRERHKKMAPWTKPRFMGGKAMSMTDGMGSAPEKNALALRRAISTTPSTNAMISRQASRFNRSIGPGGAKGRDLKNAAAYARTALMQQCKASGTHRRSISSPPAGGALALLNALDTGTFAGAFDASSRAECSTVSDSFDMCDRDQSAPCLADSMTLEHGDDGEPHQIADIGMASEHVLEREEGKWKVRDRRNKQNRRTMNLLAQRSGTTSKVVSKHGNNRRRLQNALSAVQDAITEENRTLEGVQNNVLAGEDTHSASPRADRNQQSPDYHTSGHNCVNKGKPAPDADCDLIVAMDANHAEAANEIKTSQQTQLGPPPARSMVLSIAHSMDQSDFRAAKLLGQAEQKALSMMSLAERRKVLSLTAQQQHTYMKNRLRSAEQAATAQLMATAQQRQPVRGGDTHRSRRRSNLELLNEDEMVSLIGAAMNESGIRGRLSGAASRVQTREEQRKINYDTLGSERMLGKVAKQGLCADESNKNPGIHTKGGRNSTLSDDIWNTSDIFDGSCGNRSAAHTRRKYLDHSFAHPDDLGTFGATTVAHELVQHTSRHLKMTRGAGGDCFDFGAGTDAQQQLVLNRGSYMKMGNLPDDPSFCGSHDGSSSSCAREPHINYRMRACSEDHRTKRDPSQSNAENASYAEIAGPRRNNGTLRNHGSRKHLKACTGILSTLSIGNDNSTGNDHNVAKMPPNVGVAALTTPTSPALSNRALSSPSFIQHRAGDKGVDGDNVRDTAQQAAQRFSESRASDDAALDIAQSTPGLLHYKAKARALYEQQRDMAIEKAIKNKLVLSLQDSQLADSRLLSLSEFHADQKRLCRRLLHENGPNAARNWQGRPSKRAKGPTLSDTKSRVSDGLWQMAAMQSAQLVHTGMSQRDDRRMQLPDEVWEYGPSVEDIIVAPARCSTAPSDMRHSDVYSETQISASGVDARFAPRMASPGRHSPSQVGIQQD
eukprot:g166.t1